MDKEIIQLIRQAIATTHLYPQEYGKRYQTVELYEKMMLVEIHDMLTQITPIIVDFGKHVLYAGDDQPKD